MIGQTPAQDASPAKVDDGREIKPASAGGDEGHVTSPRAVFRLDGARAALGHDPANSHLSAGDPTVGEFLSDSTVAIAPAMAAEDGFDESPIWGSERRVAVGTAAW